MGCLHKWVSGEWIGQEPGEKMAFDDPRWEKVFCLKCDIFLFGYIRAGAPKPKEGDIKPVIDNRKAPGV